MSTIRLDGLNRDIMSHWLERAQEDGDNVNKFISVWIAFNHYYATYWLKLHERQIRKRVECGQNVRIKDKEGIGLLIKQPICHEIYRSMQGDCALSIKLPVMNDITGEEVPFGKRGQIEIKDISIQQCFDILYQIRNNLFHGRKIPDKEKRDKELCKFGYSVLFPFLKRLLAVTS